MDQSYTDMLGKRVPKGRSRRTTSRVHMGKFMGVAEEIMAISPARFPNIASVFEGIGYARDSSLARHWTDNGAPTTGYLAACYLLSRLKKQPDEPAPIDRDLVEQMLGWAIEAKRYDVVQRCAKFLASDDGS